MLQRGTPFAPPLPPSDSCPAPTRKPSEMQSVSSLRTSAFGSSRVAPMRASRASTVVVQAVQDLRGKVVSTAMNKTVVVAVERLAVHPVYQKRIRLTKRYHARDEHGVAVGDYVLLEGCRPLSKLTRFTVSEVLQKANQ